MRLGILSRISIFLASLAVSSLACAQDSASDDALPDIGMLPCAGACASITNPVPVGRHRIEFPRILSLSPTMNDYPEAMVTLRLTVEADGTVGDITTVEQLGPDEFVKSAKASLKDWTYKPATSEGKPVAAAWRVIAIFSTGGTWTGARPAVITAYRDAAELYKSGKLDDAILLLKGGEALPRLNFYERGMLANLQTAIAIKRGDYMEARRLATLPTRYGQKILPADVMRGLWHFRIAADLQLGDLADAVRSLEELRKVPGFDPADPAIATIAEYRKKADAAPAFIAEGKIPAANQGDAFTFELYSRDFTIQKISGGLQKMTMDCNQRSSESPISEKAEWHIPRTWNGCHLYLRGEPGTTFQIVQFPEQPPPAAP